MACENRKWWIVIILVLTLSSSFLYCVEGEPQVPCFFIFGDSLVDNGNNNKLLTLARSNFPPNGIDFPNGKATGRFSNGRTMADFIAEFLGFEDYIPPFADSSGGNILQGVNYASGGSGIKNETGAHWGERISMDKQLKNHQTIISRINYIIGSKELTYKYLNKCLYYVNMGSNDYIDFFKKQVHTRNHISNPEDFANDLIQQYSRQIKTLYENGARKVALYGLSAAGCTPYEIAKYGTKGNLCVEELNSQIRIFNLKLISLVDELNTNYTNAQFIFVNFFDPSLEIIYDPSSYGFKVIDTACCGIGKNNSFPCIPLQIPCKNRREYIFWDAFHPSEAVSEFAAQRSYRAQKEGDTYPMDIYTLAQLRIDES